VENWIDERMVVPGSVRGRRHLRADFDHGHFG